MDSGKKKQGEAELKSRIKELEHEVHKLKQREAKFQHDIDLFKQIFEHMKKQFSELQKKIEKKLT